MAGVGGFAADAMQRRLKRRQSGDRAAGVPKWGRAQEHGTKRAKRNGEPATLLNIGGDLDVRPLWTVSRNLKTVWRDGVVVTVVGPGARLVPDVAEVVARMLIPSRTSERAVWSDTNRMTVDDQECRSLVGAIVLFVLTIRFVAAYVMVDMVTVTVATDVRLALLLLVILCKSVIIMCQHLGHPANDHLISGGKADRLRVIGLCVLVAQQR